MPPLRLAAFGTLLAGGLLLCAGCDTSPGEDYQTLTPSEAEHIEQVREQRAAEQNSRDGQTLAKASPVVLLAAENAAAAVRSSVAPAPDLDQSPDDSRPPASADQPRASGETTSTTDAQSVIAVAASRAARAVAGEPIVRTIQLLVPDRSFTVEGPDEAIRISYDDFDLLKVLNMEPVPTTAVDHFPQWLSNLDGQRVRLRGFMYPTFQETDIRAFVLARDNQICCFGRNPKIYDLVEVTLADGVTTDYIQGRPFDVVGVFHIRPETDGDELWQLYQLDDAVVIDE